MSTVDTTKAIELLFRLSEPRGREAAGLAIAKGSSIEFFKRATAPSTMLNGRHFKAFLRTSLESATVGPMAAVGHCRLVTNGVQAVHENNQPVVAGSIVGVHNGIVTNEGKLRARHDELSFELDIDTEVLFRLIDRNRQNATGLAEATASSFSEIEGAASFALLCQNDDALVLATNCGSIYFAESSEIGLLVFASERYILEEFVRRAPRTFSQLGKAMQLAAGTGISVGFNTAQAQAFSLAHGVQTSGPSCENAPAPSFRITDRSAERQELRRCSKCILPETYPLIVFDGDGICNFCRNYDPVRPSGHNALEAELSRHRKDSGDPDCIIAFSGGRDSSYGLHLLVKEYGMTPIAFTYDWGMVTDLARRNQARVCGKLGVEHIIRCADIQAKRRNLRLNVEGWLKRPNLGMIPLFMAGDKMFYHYARQLRHETGIDLVIFCGGNELERTDFKTGFCGVRENRHGQRLFGFSATIKARLALWYAWQYCINPRYFNRSLLDTLFAFHSTFIGRDDFLYLYQYLPWNEDDINQTLKREYDWEGACDTENTWRVGDEYTAFINYIYHTVAGFSEYDTFRSNQIREDILTRAEALEKTAEDNQFRLETLREFALHTGINLEETLIAVNAIPKLY